MVIKMKIPKAVPPKLIQFFGENPKIALAFSGGVDSAYLMYAAAQCGCDCKAYYVKSQFQPEFELEHGKELSKEIGVPMEILPLDVLSEQVVVDNPSNRCYYCKNAIFGSLLTAIKKDGHSLLMDGTNASDDADDRPGMKALKELKILSPLRLCGITKTEIRKFSKEAGLFTWNKPAYACLATRIATGQVITAQMLEAIQTSESYLFGLGYSDFRIRVEGTTAKIQMTSGQIEQFIKDREAIYEKIKPNFDEIVLDLKTR